MKRLVPLLVLALAGCGNMQQQIQAALRPPMYTGAVLVQPPQQNRVVYEQPAYVPPPPESSYVAQRLPWTTAENVSRYCGFAGVRIQDCIDNQQAAYDDLKIIWPHATPKEQTMCVQRSGANYELLEACTIQWMQNDDNWPHVQGHPFQP